MDSLTPEKGVLRSGSVGASGGPGAPLTGGAPTMVGLPPDRKRKRKGDESGGSTPGGPTKPRVNTAGAAPDGGKIRDYFNKHTSSSPVRHGGAKSPSPQQGNYPMVRLMISILIIYCSISLIRYFRGLSFPCK